MVCIVETWLDVTIHIKYIFCLIYQIISSWEYLNWPTSNLPGPQPNPGDFSIFLLFELYGTKIKLKIVFFLNLIFARFHHGMTQPKDPWTRTAHIQVSNCLDSFQQSICIPRKSKRGE
jgi:hypothetical protein